MKPDMCAVRSGAAMAAILAAALWAAAPSAPAQSPSTPSQGAAADPIAQRVFPPDLIMGHAGEIGLTPLQRDRIIEEVKSLQSHADQIAPRLERDRAQMIIDLDAEPADEARVLKALDDVLASEREIKRLHIATLVRLRNLLTPAQRARLNAFR
jgi:Spy/CpxP family protein refolding chaperone